MVSCEGKPLYEGPLSPEESMKTFQLAENFKVEIFASEPLVIDPVSMQYDGDGNAYVVGMLDAYKDDSVKGKGKIVMLKDTNGDGRADTSTVFVDSLREATSVLPWKGGLLVCAAPNITYYKDTDGDGRSDLKEILFSGFFNKNEEVQITNLHFGIDNWIYANNGGQAGEISFSRRPDAPRLNVQGADFRFRLDRNEFERSTGPGQFGLAIDDWGHRFFTANSLHIREVVVPLRYLERNPYLPASTKSTIQNISDHDPLMHQLSETPYWRQERTDRRNKNYQENNLDRVEYARGHFTGASGGTYYDGDKFSKEYYGNIFTGDVAGSLVHRDILSVVDSLPYMVAKRGEKEKDKEFMATTDSWFRPANFSVGPDGYMYIMDMYRQHIETPMSIPEDLQETMDFDAGNEYGRIYRIVPKDVGPYKPVYPNLTKVSSSELVKALQHENRWWNLTAQRLLLERQDKSVIPEVRALFAQSENPRFRLHALYVLEGMDALDAVTVMTAMKDPSAGVRENAAILSERFPDCLSQLAEMINDPSIRVAFQATLSLGQLKDKAVIPALAKALELHGQSSWFRTAVLSSEAGSGIDLLKILERNSFFKDASSWKLNFIETCSNVIGARNNKNQISGLLSLLAQSSLSNTAGLQSASIKGLVEGIEKSAGLENSLKEKLKSISLEAEGNVPKAIQDLIELYAK
ncbi:PVC-type heme-binding CxxCH protein [Arenibacter algicola]|uniref:PVC-type heme-binding CxxCH protein n=1 Tax=Arenibacter algicola TaxID=616991 RepID=UPI003F53FDFF